MLPTKRLSSAAAAAARAHIEKAIATARFCFSNAVCVGAPTDPVIVGVAFNGGKDSIVALELLAEAAQGWDNMRRLAVTDLSTLTQPMTPTTTTSTVITKPSSSSISIAAPVFPDTALTTFHTNVRLVLFYFDEDEEFEELHQFRHAYCDRRGLVLHPIPCKGSKGQNKQSALWSLHHLGMHVVVLGTRRSDGECCGQSGALQWTSAGWAPMWRCAPLFEWTTCQVWQYIKQQHVDYCALYDAGYSSLGAPSKTVKDPRLRRADGSYAPAWAHPRGDDRVSRL